jgi:hypothetical protein
VAVPVGSLAKKMGLFSVRGLLVTPVCRPSLLSASFRTAGWTTVALATVAMAAYMKKGITGRPTTETRPENRFWHRGRRHLDSALHLITIHRIGR